MESNVLNSGNQHLHFSACETFSGCKRTKTYREGSREKKCCNSFNRNTNKITHSNANTNTDVNTNSITVEYESETGGVGWRQTGCGNALKVSLSTLGNLFQRILPVVLINIFACPQIRIWVVLRFNKAHHQVAEMWPCPGSNRGKPKLKHPRLLLNSLSTHARL